MFWLLWVIVVGLIAGWLASKIMKRSGGSLVMDLLLGVVGAVVGGWLVRLLGFSSGGGLIPSIVTATIGAIALIALARAIH
ncbi:MAG TPA: GlsB/YeaQ/YmgE family stress response membrane protein [Terriglobales bacterium]|nr:GlsB/YeaQ/YmgE family stress response membrane protein [Terriglobales bacterium]